MKCFHILSSNSNNSNNFSLLSFYMKKDLVKASSSDNTKKKKTLNEICTELGRSCLNKDLPQGHNLRNLLEQYYFRIHLRLPRQLSLKDEVFLNFFQYHPLSPCWYGKDDDEQNNFFFTTLNINSKLNLFLFRKLANENKVEVFAVTSEEIEE